MAAALTKGVTYTSIGYGYPVLPKPWCLLVSVEALTGIRMCGLFFALLTGFMPHAWKQLNRKDRSEKSSRDRHSNLGTMFASYLVRLPNGPPVTRA